jgi:hypothetical protein
MISALKQNRRLQAGTSLVASTTLSGIWGIWHPLLAWDRYDARRDRDHGRRTLRMGRATARPLTDPGGSKPHSDWELARGLFYILGQPCNTMYIHGGHR